MTEKIRGCYIQNPAMLEIEMPEPKSSGLEDISTEWFKAAKEIFSP